MLQSILEDIYHSVITFSMRNNANQLRARFSYKPLKSPATCCSITNDSKHNDPSKGLEVIKLLMNNNLLNTLG